MITIRQYKNGNCWVEIKNDGTKIRSYDNTPNPVFPESLDLRCTNWCDAGCKWCHEKSTKKEPHGSLDSITEVFNAVNIPMEIAIGGGDPLMYPDLVPMLQYFRDKDFVANVTVNARHINRHYELINRLRKQNLIYGLGISYHTPNIGDIVSIYDDNTVIHFIAGVDNPNSLIRLYHQGCRKFLILGYKQYGRGLKYYSAQVLQSLNHWNFSINRILSLPDILVAFDNLGLEQLNIKNRIKPHVWEQYYMGDDGTFTMYYDAVYDCFAKTSTSERFPRQGKTLQEMFKIINRKECCENIKSES